MGQLAMLNNEKDLEASETNSLFCNEFLDPSLCGFKDSL